MKPRLKISVPKFDNSDLIASYSKTLIGRCMNPLVQDVKTLLYLFPRFWGVEGRVAGVDLGLGRFQFNFDLEEDIVEVLKMEPFHFDLWMVALVRWKPVLEPNYPSSLTFWVYVQDMPLQFRVTQIFQAVGEALGLVKSPVDLVEGRVRVEIDGFKPLVFSATVEIGEGVEITVKLWYERLIGYCKECFHLTHDHLKCPKLIKALPETSTGGDPFLDGAKATSYKAAVVHGDKLNGERRAGHQNRFPGSRVGVKGKGLNKDLQGEGKIEGSFHPYREKGQRGYKVSQYGFRRNGNQPRNLHPAQAKEGDRDHGKSEKLMLDAFKGEMLSSPVRRVQQDTKAGGGTLSKARKALVFEDEVVENAVDTNPLEVSSLVLANSNAGLDDVTESDTSGLVQRQQEADGENLNDEGMMLSDSELLAEDGDLECWENGAEMEFMEDNDLVCNDQALAELEIAGDHLLPSSEDKAMEDKAMEDSTKVGNELPEIKAMAQHGIGTVDGPSKKRGAPIFVSPRKKLLAQAAAKVGEKGNRKGAAKPKLPPQ
ncbi:unnamed protein product [Eruca vesicaria subsp. sativa]|uniref:DUF4283 domain-containing protein n=1 Tax=Eruca vesicaria subsp. sativa TaxID=29727 RepID=A0ABC8LAA9_ERUVS|nr:unnamed protein product [Eruca vesicaria subsp. sativa]